MGVASTTFAAYRDVLERLLPGLHGRLFFSAPQSSDWGDLLDGLGAEFSRVHNVAVEWLVKQCYPDTATGSSSVDDVDYGGLLDEWLRVLGLPDAECGITLGTEAAQQGAAAAKLRAVGEGGQSAAYLVAIVLAAGYTITIESGNDGPHPFRVGTSRVDEPLYGAEWAHAFIVHAQLSDATYFRIGTSGIDEPLVDWAGDIIECLIDRLKPTDSIPHYVYS